MERLQKLKYKQSLLQVCFRNVSSVTLLDAITAARILEFFEGNGWVNAARDSFSMVEDSMFPMHPFGGPQMPTL